MAASWPVSVKIFTTKADGVDIVQAAHVNDMQDEVTAMQQSFLTGPLTIPAALTLSALLTVNAAIKFPASQAASSNVNTLDDYEEGTWVPAIASAGGGAATYSVQGGYYTKIGDTIHFWGRITMATVGTLGAGAVTITGLPLAALNNASYFGGCTFTWFAGLTTAMIIMMGTIAPNTQVITVRHLAAAATSGLTTTLVADLSGTTDLIFYGSYKTAT